MNDAHESTQAAIRNAALHLFSTVGFSGTGIRLIAQEAGVSLATLYHYMSNKEDLLVGMVTENIVTLLRDAELALLEVAKPVDQLAALVEVHVRIHTEQRLLCIVSDTEIRSLSEEQKQKVVGYRDQYEAIWRRTIQAGRSAEDFQVKNVAVAARALIEMCTGVAHWYRPEGPIELAELVDLYTDLCANALRAQKTRRRREQR
ncbi:TetR/AcrR family transcriptional regulator [Nocardioides sp. L-11A]|uniref:TetR/AcrR family transcriptional regulator n=1 Tax=Nocardioides sp. L-11A TaxID=3043848 RepID=UPI00249ACFCC|nr:TetR/AcrR family transcriptional regulator [Nocardioides sp. L-11A]